MNEILLSRFDIAPRSREQCTEQNESLSFDINLVHPSKNLELGHIVLDCNFKDQYLRFYEYFPNEIFLSTDGKKRIQNLLKSNKNEFQKHYVLGITS